MRVQRILAPSAGKMGLVRQGQEADAGQDGEAEE